MIAIFAPLALSAAALPFLPSFAQDPSYHEFADQRTIAGVPHFGDVATSLLLTLVGLHGLWVVFLRRRWTESFVDPRDRRAYGVMFAGIALTGVGSAYYHLDPTTSSLFWDRLPMTLIFAPMFAIAVAERIGPDLGRRVLLPAVVVGVGGVVYWHLTETFGTGDVRIYGLVQFYPMLAVPLMLALFPARYTHAHTFWGLLGAYGIAKVFETFDADVLLLNGFASGHNLKHVFAALGLWALVGMLRKRTPLSSR
ncbi:MAG: alkaline phytoceramidase [Deltaproteobacteria bacterium]|nr:alkaline phytoceramidase [Deltaproteobacteria bacterium]